MRKLRIFTFLVVLFVISLLANGITMNLIAFASVGLCGQEQTSTWERYTANEEEFSVLMPELPGVISRTTCLGDHCEKKRLENIYAAYSEGGVYLITSYHNPKRRQSFDTIINESLDYFKTVYDVAFQGDVKLKEFTGKKYLLTWRGGGYDRVVVFYLTRDHVYEVAAVKDSTNDPSVQKFFGSIVLGEKIGKDIGVGARTEAFTVSVKPVSSHANEGQQAKDTQQGKVNSPQTILRPNEVTRKAAIVFKGVPEYTEEARQNQVTGKVTLQMIFDSSGRVANIRTISGLPHGLTESAIKIARKIYFIPALKDGERVSQYIRVEYNFHIY